MADFAPERNALFAYTGRCQSAVPPGESWRITRYAANSKVFGQLCENMTSSTKPEVRERRVALSSEEDRATATGNVYGKS